MWRSVQRKQRFLWSSGDERGRGMGGDASEEVATFEECQRDRDRKGGWVSWDDGSYQWLDWVPHSRNPEGLWGPAAGPAAEADNLRLWQIATRMCDPTWLVHHGGTTPSGVQPTTRSNIGTLAEWVDVVTDSAMVTTSEPCSSRGGSFPADAYDDMHMQSADHDMRATILHRFNELMGPSMSKREWYIFPKMPISQAGLLTPADTQGASRLDS